MELVAKGVRTGSCLVILYWHWRVHRQVWFETLPGNIVVSINAEDKDESEKINKKKKEKKVNEQEALARTTDSAQQSLVASNFILQ